MQNPAVQTAKAARDSAVKEVTQLQQELDSLKKKGQKKGSGFSIRLAIAAGVIGIMVGLILKLVLSSPSAPPPTLAPPPTAAGTDIENITRKEPKPDKNRHENGKSAQEPEVFYQQWSTKKCPRGRSRAFSLVELTWQSIKGLDQLVRRQFDMDG
ncbi:vesicle-associated protein 2-1 isoform X1 [Tanacetum coccineum]